MDVFNTIAEVCRAIRAERLAPATRHRLLGPVGPEIISALCRHGAAVGAGRGLPPLVASTAGSSACAQMMAVLHRGELDERFLDAHRVMALFDELCLHTAGVVRAADVPAPAAHAFPGVAEPFPDARLAHLLFEANHDGLLEALRDPARRSPVVLERLHHVLLFHRHFQTYARDARMRFRSLFQELGPRHHHDSFIKAVAREHLLARQPLPREVLIGLRDLCAARAAAGGADLTFEVVHGAVRHLLRRCRVEP